MRKNDRRKARIYVEEVYSSNLCCSCGVCEGICPQNAIRLIVDKYGFYKPIINKKKCINCGMCQEYCPGSQYINKNESITEVYSGYGHSNNKNLRKNSSSGGIATELLCYLLRNGIVDYVNVVKDIKTLKKPQNIITNNPKEVIKCSSSKYCPTPIGKIIKTIKNKRGKFAVIGLPCQITAIKKYFENNRKKTKGKVSFYLSLFCNHVPSFNATDYILKNLGIRKIKKIRYRGHGWPGYIEIKTKTKTYLLPYRKTCAIGFMTYFKNQRCRICDDPFGKNADISFGDAYFLSEKENQEGNTYFIIRNKKMLKHFRNMQKHRIIKILDKPTEKQIQRAYSAFFKRIEEVPYNLYIRKLLGKKNPQNSPLIPKKISFLKKLRKLISFKKSILGRHKYLWSLLYRYKKFRQRPYNVIIKRIK